MQILVMTWLPLCGTSILPPIKNIRIYRRKEMRQAPGKGWWQDFDIYINGYRKRRMKIQAGWKNIRQHKRRRRLQRERAVSRNYRKRQRLFWKNGRKEFSVIFSTEELEKMAADEKYAKEKINAMKGAVRMSGQINEQFGQGTRNTAYGEKEPESGRRFDFSV